MMKIKIFIFNIFSSLNKSFFNVIFKKFLTMATRKTKTAWRKNKNQTFLIILNKIQ